MRTLFNLGGKDYFGGPVTRFDIPFLWPSIPHFPDYRWNGFNLPGVTFAKGKRIDCDNCLRSMPGASSDLRLLLIVSLKIELPLLCLGIGGSELHSAMTYVRTHPADIEKWNVPGWTWSRVLRTFMRIESYMAEDGKRLHSYCCLHIVSKLTLVFQTSLSNA